MDKIKAALPKPHSLLIVLSGFSGVGKDSVVKRMKELGYPFHFVVTATTRPPREGEVPGKDYHFLSEEAFVEMIEQDEFLEHALVYGEYKGVPKAHIREAMASGQDVLMRLDVQGASTMREMVPDALLIFIAASSEEELIGRLRARKTETEESLRKRVKKIEEEAAQIPLFDYVVINRDGRLDETVEQIGAIISAEKCRVDPRKAEI
jgi:guanylate kinase